MPPTDLRTRAVLKQDEDEITVTDVHSEVIPLDGQVIGIQGVWYDVKNFLKYHPGGPIIEQFVGKDATEVFMSVGHKPEILKRVKAVGKYTRKIKGPADIEFEKLLVMFIKKGFFKTDWIFYFKKIFVALSLWIISIFLVLGFSGTSAHMLGAVVLAFSWQQSGFIMHEFMHTQVLRRGLDHQVGIIFGAFIFGISAHWWRDEHIFHHAMTNVVNSAKGFADPQMHESVWAQNTKLFPLFKGKFDKYLISIQHFTFVPVVVLFGRLEIMFDSYIKERRPLEWIGIIGHWIWVCYLFSHLASWQEIAAFYSVACIVQGIFHFQLILSHYCKLFMEQSEYDDKSWYEYQILSNMNIDTYWWLDWYYGGLNFHIEHHLYPTMARKHLREAAEYIYPLCKKHNIDYDSRSFYGAMTLTLSHLKETGIHYKLDPR